MRSNRAAVYLRIGKVAEALNDAALAVEQLRKGGNIVSLARAHVRKGAAHACLGQLRLALEQYETAAALCPELSTIASDCAALKKALQGSSG